MADVFCTSPPRVARPGSRARSRSGLSSTPTITTWWRRTAKKSQWVQNLQADPQISFCVGTREDHGSVRKPHRGHGRVVDVEREPSSSRPSRR